MILGIGIDIVHISRIERAVQRFGDRFLHRAFCRQEIEYCNRKRNPCPCLSARFAAKEALVKALGTGFRSGITLGQICVENSDSGAPFLTLSGKAQEKARCLAPRNIHISISHERDIAVSLVVLEGGDD